LDSRVRGHDNIIWDWASGRHHPACHPRRGASSAEERGPR